MRSKLIGISFALLIPAILMAGDIERSRKVVRSFKADERTSIQVVNKYGNVHMIPWEKDSVRFEIQLTISGTKQPRVDKIFTDIDFDFTSTKYYVIARTEFSNSMNSLWSEINDATAALFVGGNKATINYTVYFPEAAPVRIENKFGNIYTTDHAGKAEIILSNGDLKAHDFKGELILEHSFGNANIHSVDHGRLELGYGEFSFDEIGDAALFGKSARISIAKAGRLRLDSRRDKIRIGQAGGLSGTTSFSYLTVDQLTDEAQLFSKYGDLDFSGTGVALRLIDLNSEYTDISIKSAPGAPLDLELSYDEKTQLALSENVRKLKQEIAGEDGKRLQREGLTVHGASRYPKIKVRLTGGSLAL